MQQLFAGLVAPVTAPLMRGLLGFDPAPAAAALPLPALVLAGGKDVQIDPDLDAHLLERAIRDAGHEVTFHLSPSADHVLKHQPLTIAEIRADLAGAAAAYNAADRVLDPDAVTAIVAWLADHTRP